MHVFHQNDIICAVKTEQDLALALQSQARDLFLLKANINTAIETVRRCHEHGKHVFIHIDLAEGFGKDDASIEYISKVVRPDGILSTKSSIVKLAIDNGLFAVYRVFLIDQQSMNSAVANIKKYKPCAVEIMPGIAYEAIRDLHEHTDVPIIAGGFVRTKRSAELAFEAGAIACSTSNMQLWSK